MQTPTDYPKTLFLLQGTDTSMYLVAAVVIYYYGGKDVKSPALSSTAPITAKIAYGIAIPTVYLSLAKLNNYTTDIGLIDCDCRSDQRTCCSQVHLRPTVPRHRSHAQENRALDWILGSHYLGALGDCVGNRRGHSGFQRLAEFDCECLEDPMIRGYRTNQGACRLLSLQAGSHVSILARIDE